MENASASTPTNPHFFKPLLPGFHSQLKIPLLFFSKYIKGTRNEDSKMVKLRSDASHITWIVKMDGHRLTQGWQNFATSHDLKVGDVVVFRHDGDLLFHVTCFGPSFCGIQYNHLDLFSEADSDSVSEKYQQHKSEEGSSLDHSCFVTCVTASNLSKDMLYLPIGFARANGLTNRQCEIILLNEDKKPWTLHLVHHKNCDRAYIRSGWRAFCCANRKVPNDFLTFKLVQAATTPVLYLCSTTSQCRFLTLTLTPYNIKECKLCLPVSFVKANGIENAREITLVDLYGIKRTTSLRPEGKYARMRMGKEWKEFCEVNGVKIGESFKLELIKEEEDAAGTHLLKFCSRFIISL